MASKSVKPDGPQGHKAMPSQALKGEGVETRRRPPVDPSVHGEGIVQGVQKWAQTGILWSQVQVLHGLPLATEKGPRRLSRRGQRASALHRADQQLPLDRPLARCVLVMVLRRQDMPLRSADLVAANSAAIDTGVGGNSAGRDQRVESLVVHIASPECGCVPTYSLRQGCRKVAKPSQRA